jgi:hypothetical protein
VNKVTGSDPVDQLRAANPIQADQVPDASLARISARIQEHIMSDVQNNPISPRSRRPLALIGGFALVGALALAVGFGSGFGAQKPGPIAAVPTPTTPAPTTEEPTGAPGGGMASCIMYDPALLPTFDVVFEGTVTAVEGDQVTFAVGTGWKGADGSITLTKPGSAISFEGALPDFEVGGRYLVTAASDNINGCGYTLAYDEATAATWAAAFAN